MALANRGNEDWSYIIDEVLTLPAHSDIIVEIDQVPPPIASGFVQSIGEPQGQLADFRKCLPSLKSIHARLFGTFYRVHWDKKDPHRDPIGHLLEDAPFWALIVVLCVAGLLIGLWTISRKE